jgi:hypothetical protein
MTEITQRILWHSVEDDKPLIPLALEPPQYLHNDNEHRLCAMT